MCTVQYEKSILSARALSNLASSTLKFLLLKKRTTELLTLTWQALLSKPSLTHQPNFSPRSPVNPKLQQKEATFSAQSRLRPLPTSASAGPHLCHLLVPAPGSASAGQAGCELAGAVLLPAGQMPLACIPTAFLP